MQYPSVIFFTGVSGAGKTSIVESLSHRFKNDESVQALHFDSIGVPGLEVMIEKYGSGKEWQKQKTYSWVDKIIHDYASKRLVLFEGQTEIKFIAEAFQKDNFDNYKIILIHAKNVDRHERLRTLRKQPQLVNAEMDNWANFLMKQALEFDASVIDTSLYSLELITDLLFAWLQKPDFMIENLPSCVSAPQRDR